MLFKFNTSAYDGEAAENDPTNLEVTVERVAWDDGEVKRLAECALELGATQIEVVKL